MTFPRLALLTTPLMIAALLAGCGGDGTQRYVQSSESARSSLETALNAWKNGDPHGTIESGDTEIDVFDARWRDGQQLESFEIVEELPADPHQTFKVTMRMKDATEDEENTYIVLGIDPIQVFRSEDYAAATGM